MTRACLMAILLFGACTEEDPTFPISPGGGGGGPGGVGSGSGSGSGAEAGVPPISGKLCLLNDLRDLETCDPGGTGEQTVRLGAGAPVMTRTDGTFDIPAEAGSNILWRVGGGAGSLHKTVTRFVPGTTTIPVIRETTYLNLLTTNGVVLVGGDGALVVQFVRVTALANVTINAGAGVNVLYDGASATTWDVDRTGPKGMAWVPAVRAPSLSFIASPEVGTAVTQAVPIEDDAITFETVDEI